MISEYERLKMDQFPASDQSCTHSRPVGTGLTEEFLRALGLGLGVLRDNLQQI